ncbi:MAG: hypothetical protein CMP61_05460 [Flavobacteriales bacterium]|nr:hypothetical protein [Flavobacteriales bacterium]|tara:strand:+ start:3131 stop:3643 length:513 start_codon:yes stop_codon:yes gene_type:complete
MKKGMFLLLLLISLLISKVSGQIDYKDSWVSLAGGGSYKGIIGFEINGEIEVGLIKLNRGRFRLSVFNELGAGPAALGFAWLSSNTQMAKVSFLEIFKHKYGFAYSFGRDMSYLAATGVNRKWGGFQTHRISFLRDLDSEVFIGMNFNHPDDFTNLLTLELGFKGKMGIL